MEIVIGNVEICAGINILHLSQMVSGKENYHDSNIICIYVTYQVLMKLRMEIPVRVTKI